MIYKTQDEEDAAIAAFAEKLFFTSYVHCKPEVSFESYTKFVWDMAEKFIATGKEMAFNRHNENELDELEEGQE